VEKDITLPTPSLSLEFIDLSDLAKLIKYAKDQGWI